MINVTPSKYKNVKCVTSKKNTTLSNALAISRLNYDYEQVKTPEFNESSKTETNAFTRNRKMPFTNLFSFVLCNKGRSLAVELMDYFTTRKTESVSKAAFSKQRLKLNPKAYWKLMRIHTKQFYKDEQAVKLYNGFILLAVDGSSCNVEPTKENIEKYGNASNKGKKPRPQIGISCMFDVENKMIIDLSTHRGRFDEREATLQHLEQTSEIIGDHKSIIIMDRGYPSLKMFCKLQKQNQYFVIRINTVTFKEEQMRMTSDDEWVDINITKRRLSKYNQDIETFESLNKLGSMKLRFVRINKPNGESTVLITNLSENIASTEDMKVLYKKRWGIETAYDILKNRFQLENFSGIKPIAIEQDIYATGYLFCVVFDFIQEAERINGSPSNHKFPTKTNTATAIGFMKQLLIHILLNADNPEEQGRLFKILYQNICKYFIYIKDNRSYPRSKNQFRCKYFKCTKRPF